jgi:hypothetical protein
MTLLFGRELCNVFNNAHHTIHEATCISIYLSNTRTTWPKVSSKHIPKMDVRGRAGAAACTSSPGLPKEQTVACTARPGTTHCFRCDAAWDDCYSKYRPVIWLPGMVYSCHGTSGCCIQNTIHELSKERPQTPSSGKDARVKRNQKRRGKAWVEREISLFNPQYVCL